jgi:hypothetical protein
MLVSPDALGAQIRETRMEKPNTLAPVICPALL